MDAQNTQTCGSAADKGDVDRSLPRPHMRAALCTGNNVTDTHPAWLLAG